MRREWFDARKHPLPWGTPLLIAVAWHVADTVLRSDPHDLFWVCYAANALLCVGIFGRIGLFVGAGFGWLLIAFPLWLHDAIRTSSWDPGCTLFHVAGVVVGAAAFGRFRLPKHTWAFALALALGLQLGARLFTDESLNVNSAFRIYDGWETVYPSYAVFHLSTVAVAGLAFAALTALNNRRFAGKGGAGGA